MYPNYESRDACSIVDDNYFYDSRCDYAAAIFVAIMVQLSKDRFLSLCYYCRVHFSKIVSAAVATAQSKIYRLCIHVLALSGIFVV